MQPFTVNWNYPTAVRVGINRSAELADYCKELGIQAPLLVTDPGLSVLPMTQQLLDSCQQAGLNIGQFSGIKGNPTESNVSDGVAAFHHGNHDGVIAFGGGSAIDAGKAIALMVGQNQSIWSFEDVGDNFKRVNVNAMVPVVAIPTTAGTGSEVGRSSVITDQNLKVKKIIFHPKMLPEIVILDPQLSVGLPPSLTAATGMDAFSHSLEAYCSNFYHPMAEGVAIEGMRLVQNWLPKAYANGGDLEARMHMLVASAMGATAFQRGLGAMHAIAHTLGALFDAHHGLLNAILMPYVLDANRHAIEQRIERLSRYLNLDHPDFDGFMAWLLAFRQSLGIPHTLSEIGIDDQQSVLVGKMSAADPSASGNPITFSADQYEAIFKVALGVA